MFPPWSLPAIPLLKYSAPVHSSCDKPHKQSANIDQNRSRSGNTQRLYGSIGPGVDTGFSSEAVINSTNRGRSFRTCGVVLEGGVGRWVGACGGGVRGPIAGNAAEESQGSVREGSGREHSVISS